MTEQANSQLEEKEACGCGCGHEHHHEHEHGHSHGEAEGECGCGHHHHDHVHEHHHEHSHDEAECSCGCGHHHHDHVHEHHHEHSHDESECSCGCGHHHHEHEHEHRHEHSHDEAECSCGCGHHHHDHEHEHGHSHDHSHDIPVHVVKNPAAPSVVYTVGNIDCAHCAAKIEEKIRELPEVDDAVLTFATKQLRVYSSMGTELLPKLQEIADYVEPGTTITVRDKRKKAAHDEAAHDSHNHDGIEILAGAALFVIGELLSSRIPMASLLCFAAAYIVLGREVLITALKNLKNGHMLDENFLMSIATLGAFAIRQFDEAVGVMLFYRIGEAFEHKAVERSRSQIMDAVDLRPEVVLLEEGGTTHEIPAEDAVVGQILHVRPGDRIPLDGVVVEGQSRIDTSPITGEPVPVSVKEGSAVTSGCVNTSGLLKIRVEKELSESMVTRILDSVENAAASKPQVERFITKFARIYTPFVVILAIATAVLPSLITGDWAHWVYTALTFLVI